MLDFKIKHCFSMRMSIEAAVEHLGSQKALAEALDVSPQMVSQWLSGKRPVSPEKARDIDRVTGGAVPKHSIRPDIFDAPANADAA